MGLRVGGQLPLRMRNITSILKNKLNWEEAAIGTTREFLYGAKYGELVDKKFKNWQDTSEWE
jgi:hypothetical protein